MTGRPPAYQNDVSSGIRSGPALLDHRDSWLGAEAGVRSQPGWSPRPEPKRISRRRWKLVLSGMFAAGVAIGCLVGMAIGWGRGAVDSRPRHQGKGS
ncbi:hypothetical protein DNFV4_04214 [Nitrospira tepida]|uniref:Uncharacterized protein n=1 Tax=Nitrospira tepida TaxID=2973512 RepID=A0AA86N332_9BACT|nr:hypothetical protein [Nitrospira tepida]CAI4033772.1 hypothetical protein DNFV4_04214 [Nitrospira tepida]